MSDCKCMDGCKNKLKEVSKSYSKNNKFEEYKVCSDGEKIKKIVIIVNFDLRIMKWIFKKNLLYLIWMIKGVI